MTPGDCIFKLSSLVKINVIYMKKHTYSVAFLKVYEGFDIYDCICGKNLSCKVCCE